MGRIIFLNEDNVPITIAKDGVWYWGEQEMIREDIVQLFSSHLVKVGGKYYEIHLYDQTCPVTVEDVPFVITQVIPAGENLKVQLNDRRVLDLPATVITLKGGTPYCSLFWEQDTKFSRAAFWQLQSYLVSTSEGYEVRYRGRVWKLQES